MSTPLIARKKYNLLNAVRIIASFFIVTIHIHFPGTFGQIVIEFARFAVPFFFMASGFFSYYENTSDVPKKIIRKIKHISVLFLGAAALYAVYGLLGGIVPYLKKIFSLTSLFEFFVFNQPKVSEHLWFLPALIYTYVVFYFFERKKITKKIYFLIPVLFVAGVALRESFDILDYPLEILKNGYLCRNFLFLGLPFFLLGHYIRANEEKLKAKFSNAVLIIMFIAGSAEAIAVGLFHLQKSVYIGSFIAVFALFIFVIKNEDTIKMPHISALGEKYSLYIYIMHIMVNNAIKKIGNFIPFIKNVYEILTPVMPIMIFAITLCISAIYVFVKTKVKAELKKRNLPQQSN